MKKCEVLAERVTLTICKGSIVYVDDVQAEVARAFLKECDKVELKAQVEEEKQEKKSKKK